jgi:hypothetical protein
VPLPFVHYYTIETHVIIRLQALYSGLSFRPHMGASKISVPEGPKSQAGSRTGRLDLPIPIKYQAVGVCLDISNINTHVPRYFHIFISFALRIFVKTLYKSKFGPKGMYTHTFTCLLRTALALRSNQIGHQEASYCTCSNVSRKA